MYHPLRVDVTGKTNVQVSTSAAALKHYPSNGSPAPALRFPASGCRPPTRALSSQACPVPPARTDLFMSPLSAREREGLNDGSVDFDGGVGAVLWIASSHPADGDKGASG